MSLTETYNDIKKSIVAFVPKYIPLLENEPPPIFPHIFGTGFVIRDKRGWPHCNKWPCCKIDK